MGLTSFRKALSRVYPGSSLLTTKNAGKEVQKTSQDGSSWSLAKSALKSFLSPVDDGQIYGGETGKMPINDWAFWLERTWRCPCGHTFRAAGTWVPTEPSLCEAPGCPNPRFFTLEKNKHLLKLTHSSDKSIKLGAKTNVAPGPKGS